MNFAGLEVSGGYFLNTRDIQLFKKHNQVASLVYGKNGSGKSSLSRAILEKSKLSLGDIELGDTEFSNIIFKELISHPEQGIQQMQTSTINATNIYVYNEKFILDNIHFKEDGLDTIIMLGDQKDIHTQIFEVNSTINKKQKKLDDLSNERTQLQDKSNINSLIYFLDAIKDKLKDRWASTESVIQNTKINTRVDINLINTLLSYTNNPNKYDVISLELNSLLIELKKLNSLNRFESIDLLSSPLDYSFINQHLEKNIVEPELNERESSILSAIKEDKGQFTNESRKFIKTESQDSCPFCYQSVSIEHKHTVLDVIKKIMHTNEANEHVNELQAIKISHLTLDLTEYNTLIDTKLLDSIKVMVDSYNNSLTKIERLISMKKINPYTPLNNTINPVDYLITLNELISNCNSIIETFNATLLNKKKIIQKLSKLNLDLALKDVKELLNQYNLKKNEEKMLTANIKLLDSELDQLNIDLQIHESKLANIDIACDVINSYLKYIFYDNNRLTLHPNDGFYLVKCRGENTKLSSLSIGERNAIALCYFFSQLFKGKTKQEIFNSKSLLVIDDPISSFDFENKVGVYSFLRFILNELHSSNADSKAIIFTHDLEAFQHFLKIYNDLGYKDKIATNQILNRSLKPINKEKFNEYSILLQSIFDYAADIEREKLEVTIGNTMRRVLEAFSTFNYKMGIEELTTNDDVLSFLPTEEQRNYYKNCMYRLVLHSESHFSERTKGLIDRGFVENFSTDEKVKTAKDILILLYSLNSFHVEIHLKKDNNLIELTSKIELLERWRREIFPELQTTVV